MAAALGGPDSRAPSGSGCAMRTKVLLWLQVLACCPFGASAAGVIPALDRADWTWFPESVLHVSGVAVTGRRWQTSVPLAQAARQLSEHFAVLDRMLILDGRIVLSGLDGDRHWLAELSRGAAGSHGMVSVLDAGPAISPTFDFSPYLPPGTQSIFSNVEILNSRLLARAAYRSRLGAPALHRHLDRVLSSSAWQQEAGQGGSRRWRRGRAQLDLQIRPDPGGTVLWMQHAQEPGTP